jgi:ribosomal-protein-alanine N-acetyltransferase
MKTGVIQSERLDLIPLTSAFMRASLQCDVHEAERLLECSLPVQWPNCCDVLARRLRELENDPTLQPWLLRAMVLRRERVMVGHIGCHTAPGADYLKPYSPGAVEFGYQVYPPYRRRGYAREASLALMRWARAEHGVTNFVVSISPDNKASQALAAKLGFTRIGSHIDEVDGLEDILEGRLSDVRLVPK